MVVLGSDPASIGVVKLLLIVGSLATILDWDVDPDVTSAPWSTSIVPALPAWSWGRGRRSGIVVARRGRRRIVKVLGGLAGLVRGLGADVMYCGSLRSRSIQTLVQGPAEIVHCSVDTSKVH